MGLCYNISGMENVLVPDFTFHFKGGSDMILPVANYFSYFISHDLICLTMISSGGSLETDIGPAIILGNDPTIMFKIMHFINIATY